MDTSFFRKRRRVMDTIFFLSMFLVLAHVQCKPPKTSTPSHRQACGDKLADIMSLVCSGRGYNAAFRPEESPGRGRFRRGIVDECCRKSCSRDILEQYCKPYPTDSPENVQIRKRSDFATDSDDTNTKEKTINKDDTIIKKSSVVKGNVDNTHRLDDNNIILENMYLNKHKKHGHNKLYSISSENIRREDSDSVEVGKNMVNNNKAYENKMKDFCLHNRHHKDTKTKLNEFSENKLIQDEAAHRGHTKTSGEVHGQIRHHRDRFGDHQYRNHHHNSKFSGRSRRGKNLADENGPEFQIGTINPYFFGKSLLHPRGGSPNYFHDTITR